MEIVIDGYNGSVNRESCKVLLKRGMIKSPSGNGYLFTRDVRLKVKLPSNNYRHFLICFVAGCWSWANVFRTSFRIRSKHSV